VFGTELGEPSQIRDVADDHAIVVLHPSVGLEGAILVSRNAHDEPTGPLPSSHHLAHGDRSR
jgi:hypothetical protein